MPSLAARALQLVSRATIKSNPQSREQLVRHLRRTMNNPPPVTLLPPGVRAARFDNGDIAGDWLQVKTARRAVLYLHGGGYIAGVTRTYHNLGGKLAADLEADLFLPDYRLAPEHPFPAAVEDAAAAYRMVLAHGWDAKHVIVMGDSAGGGLALALLLKLRDEGLPLPACAVAMSPFADMTASAQSHLGNDDSDAMLSARMLAVGEDIYVRDPEDFRHPYASPVFGDFTGLPPLLLSVDEAECLRDDAHAVAARAKEAQVPVHMIVRRGVLHVWPVFYPLLPEAREDVAKIVSFIRRTVLARVP